MTPTLQTPSGGPPSQPKVAPAGHEADLIQGERDRLNLTILTPEKIRQWEEIYRLLGVHEDKRDFSVWPREMSRETFFAALQKIDQEKTLEAKTEALLDLMKAYSPHTFEHLKNVDLLAKCLAAFFPELKMDELALAMKLHDIGKIGVPLHVIEHQGRYVDEQRQIMRLHPELSGAILSAFGYSPDITNFAYFHHIRQLKDSGELDPLSYPNALFTQSKLDTLSKDLILGFLIDEYESMTSESRAFSTRYTKEKALELLHTKYDGTRYAEDLAVFDQAVRSIPGRIGVE